MVNVVVRHQSPDERAFNDENDCLKLQDFGTRLKNLVDASSEGAVIAIDAPWGEGKTTFIHMWMRSLYDVGDDPAPKPLYLDAFAHDHHDDPFIPLAGTLLKHCRQRPGPSHRELKQRTVAVFRVLGGLAGKVAIRYATAGLLDEIGLGGEQDPRGVARGIVNDATADVGRLIGDYLDEFARADETLQDFKDTLAQVARNYHEETGSPLVFVIDELDRCRPSFAVTLLERIKHFFDIPHIVFVLVVNRKPLEQSIAKVYGIDDADVYLGKFIHIWASLPRKAPAHKYIGNTAYNDYCQKLYERHALQAWGLDPMKEAIVRSASLMALSLRECERLVGLIALFALQSSAGPVLPELVAFLASVKVKSPETFEALRDQSIDYETLKRRLAGTLTVLENDHFYHYIDAMLRACLLDPIPANDEDASHAFLEIERRRLEPRSAIPLFCQHLDIYQQTR